MATVLNPAVPGHEKVCGGLRAAPAHRLSILAIAVAKTLLISLSLYAQGPPPDDQLIAAIDELVEKNGIHAAEPGVAIMVNQPGRLLLRKGYGLADLKTQQPITPRMLFELAAVSKTFTATAVLILHDRKALSSHDDVRKFLPELPVYDNTRPIRIENLLQHTSGLPDWIAWQPTWVPQTAL